MNTAATPLQDRDKLARYIALRVLNWKDVPALAVATELLHRDGLNNAAGHLSSYMACRYLDTYRGAYEALTHPSEEPPKKLHVADKRIEPAPTTAALTYPPAHPREEIGESLRRAAQALLDECDPQDGATYAPGQHLCDDLRAALASPSSPPEDANARTPLDRLIDFMVEETLAMTDEEVLAEAAEAGEDIEEIARAGRTDVEAAIARSSLNRVSIADETPVREALGGYALRDGTLADSIEGFALNLEFYSLQTRTIPELCREEFSTAAKVVRALAALSSTPTPPWLLQARETVAGERESQGDTAQAVAYRRGDHDDILRCHPRFTPTPTLGHCPLHGSYPVAPSRCPTCKKAGRPPTPDELQAWGVVPDSTPTPIDGEDT